MDQAILLMHGMLPYFLAFAGLLILIKFFAAFFIIEGNFVDSFLSFFRFYSGIDINTTDTRTLRLYKLANNVLNSLLYVVLLISIAVHYINVTPQE